MQDLSIFIAGMCTATVLMFFSLSIRYFISKLDGKPLTIEPKDVNGKPKKRFKLFEREKPRLYDRKGHLINFDDLPPIPEQPITPPTQAYNFNSDTTATIVTRGENMKTKDVKPTEQVEVKGTIIGYCVRCKSKQVIKDAKVQDMDTTKGVKRIAKGKCTVCGTNMGVILKKD